MGSQHALLDVAQFPKMMANELQVASASQMSAHACGLVMLSAATVRPGHCRLAACARKLLSTGAEVGMVVGVRVGAGVLGLTVGVVVGEVVTHESRAWKLWAPGAKMSEPWQHSEEVMRQPPKPMV